MCLCITTHEEHVKDTQILCDACGYDTHRPPLQQEHCFCLQWWQSCLPRAQLWPKKHIYVDKPKSS